MRLTTLFVVFCSLLGGGIAATGHTPVVPYLPTPPVFSGDWDAHWHSAQWPKTPVLEIGHFHKQSSATRPRTLVRIYHNADGVGVIWRVEDTLVTSVQTQHMQSVSYDSCVEFFFEPRPELGYINLEINAGGTVLWRWQQPAPPGDTSGRRYLRIPPPAEIRTQIKVRHSLPDRIDPPMAKPTVWYIEAFIPEAVLRWAFGRDMAALTSSTWRVNFYKLLGDPKHPHSHWAAWSPIGDILNFHRPEIFAPLRFETPPPR